MLYIVYKNNLTEITFKKGIQLANKSTLHIIKCFCERELFTYESRIKLTKRFLNIKSKIPIYINNTLLLMPVKSPKCYDCWWLNYFEVFSYEEYFGKTIVLFYNLKEVVVDISFASFHKMYLKGKKVKQYFDKRNAEIFTKEM